MDPSASASHAIVRPDWARKPTSDEVGEYYPKAALDQGLSGSALLACAVTGDGSLQRCQIVSETPQGAGFGSASLSMAPLFRMRPMTVDGQPVEGGTVRIPIHFIVPQQEKQPAHEPLHNTAPTVIQLGVLMALAALGYLLARQFGRGRAPAPAPETGAKLSADS